MSRKYYITVLIFVFFFVTITYSQHQPFFEKITEKDGLTDNRVTCFLKDRVGYLWIGTESGLNKYNGNTFISYLPAIEGKSQLSSAYITAIKQATSGDIWVATRKGINRIHTESDSIEVIRSPTVNTTIDFPGEVILDVFPDTDTSVWLAIDAKAMVRFNPVTRQFFYFDFRAFLKKKGIEFTPRYHSVFKIINKSDEELWLATTDGIFRFNKRSGEFTLEKGVALDEISFFHYDKQHRKLYCADERNILYIYEEDTRKTIELSLKAEKYLSGFLAPYTFAGNLLFVPAPEGIALIDQQNKVVSFLKRNSTNDESLIGGRINTVYKDRDNITWVGTTKGINKFVPQLNKNLHVSFPKNLTFDPDYSLKNFIYNTATNEWWIASFSDNTIWRVNNKSGLISKLEKPVDFRNDICYAFYQRNPDTLFLLCDSILLIFYPQKNTWSRLKIPAPYKVGTLTSMAIDESGNYWFGTRRRGLFAYDYINQHFWSPNEKDFPFKIIHALEYDKRKGDLWIATYDNGLYRYNVQDKKIEVIQRNDVNPQAMHSSLINDICIDYLESVWVATIEGGLSKYCINDNPEKGVTNFDINNGLLSNSIYSLTKDGQGNIWFSTIKGIGMINTAGELKAFFNNQSGLPFSKFDQSIVALDDGLVATTVENNFFCFYPSSLLEGNDYPVLINELIINDSIRSQVNNASFSHHQNTIRFKFSALDFVSPGAIEYYYKLKGVEEEWVPNGNIYTVRYTNLPPGKYTFYVKAKKANGAFYKQIAQRSFEIKPAFWQTALFRVILISLLAFFVYLLFKKRIGAVRAKAAYKQKMTELEVKALRAQMNPHFIFNAMNSIQQYTLQNDTDNANLYISKFSTLLRKVLHSSQFPTITVEEELAQLSLYLDIEKVRMGPEFHFYFRIDEQIEADALRIPGMLIQPYVENSLKHGLALKEGAKIITIEFKMVEDISLSVIVSDNGIGRLKAAAINKVQQELLPHHSKGIKLVQERIHLLTSNTLIVNRCITTDLYDDKGESAGTKVMITIPLYKV